MPPMSHAAIGPGASVLPGGIISAQRDHPAGPGSVGRKAEVAMLPVISRPLLNWFTWYAKSYLRQHFHTLRLSRGQPPPTALSCPLVFYANHPSWWDPLVAIALRDRFFPEHRAFAPIDAAALQKYKFFAKLGFFPVTRERRGALQFLKTAEAVLSHSSHILLVTPQGRFADTRERPVEFKPGLGHLAMRMPNVAFVPLALDYAFWNERKPEVLIRFGSPTRPATMGNSAEMDAGAWTKFFQGELERTQDALTADAVSRDSSRFDTFLQSQSGVGGVYDLWRRFRAFLKREPFHPEHQHP